MKPTRLKRAISKDAIGSTRLRWCEASYYLFLKEEKKMVTLVLAAVGVLSYLAYIPSLTIQQLISLFTECHNVIAWICAVAATARYFFSDD